MSSRFAKNIIKTLLPSENSIKMEEDRNFISSFLGDDFSFKEISEWSSYISKNLLKEDEKEVCGIFRKDGMPLTYFMGEINRNDKGQIFVSFPLISAPQKREIILRVSNCLSAKLPDGEDVLIIPPMLKGEEKILRIKARERFKEAFSELDRQINEEEFEKRLSIMPLGEMNELTKRLKKVSRKIKDGTVRHSYEEE